MLSKSVPRRRHFLFRHKANIDQHVVTLFNHSAFMSVDALTFTDESSHR